MKGYTYLVVPESGYHEYAYFYAHAVGYDKTEGRRRLEKQYPHHTVIEVEDMTTV